MKKKYLGIVAMLAAVMLSSQHVEVTAVHQIKQTDQQKGIKKFLAH